MKKLSTFFYQKSTLWVAFTVTVILSTYFYFVFMEMAKDFAVEGNNVTLGLSFGIPYELAQEYFAIRTDEMIKSYKNFNLIWDNIFPLLYGIMYVCWISLLYKPFSNRAKLINLIPFIQTILDWCENFFLVNMADDVLETEAISESTVQMASTASFLKWTCSGIIFLIIIVGVVWRVTRVIKGTNKPEK